MNEAYWSLKSSVWETAPEVIYSDRISIDEHRWIELVPIGRIFAFNGEQPAQALRKLIPSKATNADVIERIPKIIWGGYIAIIVDEQSNYRLFLPDPMGSVRLYFRQLRGGKLDVDIDPVRLIAGRMPVWNIGYLIHFAETGQGIEGNTPFLDLAEVPPGFCIRVNSDGTFEMVRAWFEPVVQEIDSSDLGQEVVGAIQALFEGKQRIAFPVSDSVISSASSIFLRKALPSIECLKLIEIPSIGSPLVDRGQFKEVFDTIQADRVNVEASDALPFAKLAPKELPTVLSERLIFLGKEEAVMDVVGRDTMIFDWEGADLLFHAAPGPMVLSDALKARGGLFALETARKLSRLRKATIFRILWDSVVPEAQYRGLFPGRSYIIPASRVKREGRFLRKQRNRLAQAQMLQSPSVSRPGTWVNPYFSQPVVEAVMRLRSFDSFTEGAADSQEISSALWRAQVGPEENLVVHGLQTNRRQSEELIRDGVLMKSGYLDRKALLNALDLVNNGNPLPANTIARIVCVEMFCRAWQSAVEPMAVPSLH
ncbi:hypothetical protein LAV84_30150 [Rhizobium sp. VS19-DR104.2]|uniref:hypothetical protein n=1 Tax=unclassified Rhizobium TaxID=2613769 RepID=UPI001C5BD038|nr:MULTISPECIES: hypothetical protein [unclassified Rhizobium]MBZ5763714.1 hypothetical protein [Rhizobium sp. VS19-DR96]MBZ5769641.1 hypothetical protein [Rhizobium sp. VS19-DR129.2]MBZ5777176.1 hypothetical protein [Rhizobium sp. VS19-DRK62.2]MBZ5788322.1 hypothetical protein [Rhizobium sp. VS19-DR121]MBZ5805775.1 hypothetical protein [Rhizobium sp. VS19-DR181]